MTPGGAAQRPRDLIITLAAQHKLPTVYYERFLVAAGGFFSYGASLIDQHQRAASYVDRILRANHNATEVFLMSSEIAKKCVAELIGTFW